LTIAPLSLHDHLFQLILKQHEQRLHVYREDTVEVFLRLIHERPVVAGYSRIVECIVEPSEGPESERYDEPDPIGLSEICLDEFRRATIAGNFVDYSPTFATATSCDDNIRA
jgi:hypothetical protein